MFLLTQVPEFSVTIMMPLAYLILLMIGAAKAISYSPVIVLGQTYLAKSIGFASGITLGVKPNNRRHHRTGCREFSRYLFPTSSHDDTSSIPYCGTRRIIATKGS